MQGLQGLQQQQLQQQLQQQVPSHHCTMEDRSTDVKKHPQRYNRKEDPITYLMHFEAIANFNGWDEAKKARAFPTYLHAAALQWYTNLDDNTKHSFRELKDAFIRRYQGANDRQKLEQDFARARYDPSYELEDYADNIEDLGAKLGKSKDEIIQKFLVGLPDAVYRWVNNSVVTDLGDALELANQGLVLFPVRQAKQTPKYSTPPRRDGWTRPPRFEEEYGGPPPQRGGDTRREEPMEFRHRGFGRNDQGRRDAGHGARGPRSSSSQHQSTGQRRDAPPGRPSTGYGGRPRWSNPPTYAKN